MSDSDEQYIQRRVRMSKHNWDYIDTFWEEKNLPKMSSGKVIEYILNDYRELDLQRFDLRFVANELKKDLLKELTNAFKEVIAEELKRIRLGTNNTDRNTQILIELLQGWMILKDIPTITTTKDFKPQFLVEVEQVVQERIQSQMIKKRSKIEKGEKEK